MSGTIAKTLAPALPDYAGLKWLNTETWRWADNAHYYAMPVALIRREFGIDAALF